MGASDSTTTRNDEFFAARMDFYISHNCTDTLEEYGYDGTSTITPTIRENLIQAMEKANE
jgi:hypothetical protein